MSTRISTSGMHSSVLSQLMKQQATLSRTQAQVASGKRFQTPAEDPIAATRVLDLERSQAQLEQFGKNANILGSRLTLTEQSFADVGTSLQRVRELAVQANSGALDDASLKAIATELQQRVLEIQDIGNRRDTNGEYLFSGFSSGTQPFSRTAAGVGFAGDSNSRQLQIGPSQSIADSIDGYRAFMGIPEGNGTFTVANGIHAGSAVADTGQVINAAAWVPGNYTIAFNGTGGWTVTNAANVQVATGTYVDGGVIGFNGVQVKVSGQPAAGDTIAIAPSGTKSLFATVDDLVAALKAGGSNPSLRAALGTNVNRALTQLDQGLEAVETARADVGARLSSIDNANSAREDLNLELETSLSGLRDLDYAESISRLNQQLTGLQAAQQAYSRISQLSLFNYL